MKATGRRKPLPRARAADAAHGADDQPAQTMHTKSWSAKTRREKRKTRNSAATARTYTHPATVTWSTAFSPPRPYPGRKALSRTALCVPGKINST